jgi:hypothetical protein
MTAIQRRHYKLNEDIISKVRVLAEYGAPVEHIAPAVGVSDSALRLWLANAKGDNPTEEEMALLAAFNEGRSAGGMRLIAKIAESASNGDTKDAQWMLTHAPAFRRHYSDNAAVTRALREGIDMAVQAMAEAGLTPELERNLLLRIQAKSGQQLVEAE